MTDSFKTDSFRRALIVGVAALTLVACGSNETTTSTPTAGGSTSEYLLPNDHVTGSPDAPVTLVEYASVACGACAGWHNQVYPEFKKKYVDTGKVRYVFREYVTGVPEYADAGFMIALCAPEENYFKNISFQFKRFNQIMKMGQQGQARDAYIGIAKSAGLSEDEFVTCLQNTELRDQYKAKMQTGVDMGVTSTPAFFINGKREKVYTVESIEDVILPILGEPIPDRSEAEDNETPETKAE
ncbi:DsbA family protein [Hellea sp.]|nr:DsbA family protein [Hellea sp.]